MTNPQQPELRRSGWGATESDSAKEALTAPRVPSERGSAGPVPEDNRQGHHPEHDQDKPVDRFIRRSAELAAEARSRQSQASESELDIGELRFRGLLAGPESGDLVVLLHGFPQDSSAWESSFGPLAAAGFRVWAPDQRGYSPGARPRGGAEYRVESLVRDVLAMAQKLGHHRFHLVGHDWGGVVGWATAAAHPDRVRSLAVLSTPHPRALADSLLRSSQVLRSSYFALFATPVLSEVALGARNGWGLRQMLRGSGLPDRFVERYIRTMIDDRALAPALRWYRALTPASARIGPVEVPTLFIWGDRDPALGPHAARTTGRHVRGAYRFEVLPGAGHWLPENHGAQVNQLLEEHLGRATEESAPAAAG